jgi:transposase InsO family protein
MVARSPRPGITQQRTGHYQNVLFVMPKFFLTLFVCIVPVIKVAIITECLQGRRRGRQFVTTRPDLKAERPPDRVQRRFVASRPNELWVVDFTYVNTWAGMAFTAFVIDVYSRRIVGWRVAGRMPTTLPLDALEMALWTRAQTNQLVDGLIHHSDAGSVYTSILYTDRLIEAGALASIGTVGDSYDNALAESTIGLYKTEMVWPEGPWRDVDHLEYATADHVWWFNNKRIHGSIGYDTPVEHEQSITISNTPTSRSLPDKKPSTKPSAIQSSGRFCHSTITSTIWSVIREMVSFETDAS